MWHSKRSYEYWIGGATELIVRMCKGKSPALYVPPTGYTPSLAVNKGLFDWPVRLAPFVTKTLIGQ